MNRNILVTLVAVALATVFGFTSLGIANDQVSVGVPAPEFELPDQDGQLHSLEDYRDQWVVLYFYPKDETPGCTTEACEFRDNIFAFRDLNAQILGVSLDDVASHKAFADNHGLPFPLLADVEGLAVAVQPDQIAGNQVGGGTGRQRHARPGVAGAYGVKTRMLGMEIAKRQTFIIAPDGTIARHYEKVDPKKHSTQVLADLAELGAP